MHQQQSRCHLPMTLALGLCVTACAVVSSASAQAPSKTDSDKAQEEAAKIATKLYGTTMKLNREAARAVGIVKGILTQDPFAVINELVDLLGLGGGGEPDITVRQARDEILAEMRKEREEDLTNRVQHLVEGLAELVANRNNPTYIGRLGSYLDDALAVTVDLRTIMTNPDPARAEMAYHLAPAYNTAITSRVVGLSTAQYEQATIDNLIVDAINTNSSLISDGDRYGGYLYNAAQKVAGPVTCYEVGDGGFQGDVVSIHTSEMDLATGWHGTFSATVPSDQTFTDLWCGNLDRHLDLRFDADPIVYLVRTAVTDQQLALLPL